MPPSTAGSISLPAVLSPVQAAVASQLPPPWSPLLPSSSWISHLLLHDNAPQNLVARSRSRPAARGSLGGEFGALASDALDRRETEHEHNTQRGDWSPGPREQGLLGQ